ncbi:MAG: serine/threonine-protein kinase [Polyangiales bacterium]
MTTSPEFPEGTELGGRYRLIRMLGEGGMGTVYEAEHAIIGRRVAVKVLHPKYCMQHEAVVRFTREARAAAAIGHENIVDVTDFGTHEGQPFLVMELLRGVTLDELMVDRDQFECARACQVIGHILSALASAHAAGIVHRDLKPENIFLAEVGARKVVKILDFGISKFQVQSDDLLTTEEGAMLGTPSYMSPEQWLSERDIDHRADLFAVGVFFYEMLTGQLPFDGATRGELMLRVVTGAEPVVPPSELAAGLPPELDAVVLKAIARDRGARYQTAQEFLDALRPFGCADIEVTPSLPVAAGMGPADTFTGQLRIPPLLRPDARSEVRDRPTLDDAAPPPVEVFVRPFPWRVAAAGAAALGALGVVAVVSLLAREPVASQPRPVTAALDAAPRDEQRVRVELRGTPPNATVTVDGVTSPSVGQVTLPRDRRNHLIAIALGAARRELSVRGDADQVLVVELTPPPPPPPPPPPAAVESPEEAHRRRHRNDPVPDQRTGRGGRHQRGLDINRRF